MSEPSSFKQSGKSNYTRSAVIPATIVKGSSGCGCGARKKSIRSNNQDQTKSNVDKVGKETKSLIEQNNQDVNIKQSELEEKPIISNNSPHYNKPRNQSFLDRIKEKFSNRFLKR